MGEGDREILDRKKRESNGVLNVVHVEIFAIEEQ